MFQNSPNPFDQKTTIAYMINTGNSAFLNVNAMDGKVVKHIPLIINGAGSITFNANELGAGTYTYSMYVDGKIIDTKLMVVTSAN